MSPLALAELIKPIGYGRPMDSGQLWLYLTLSVSCLVFTILHLRFYQRQKEG